MHSTGPLINVLLLFSDIDECALINNNCSKGGANCTNTLGSFNCTCQTHISGMELNVKVCFLYPYLIKF